MVLVFFFYSKFLSLYKIFTLAQYLMSGAPYGVRPARPSSYLVLKNRRRRQQRRRAAIIGVLPGLGARAAPVARAPLVTKLKIPSEINLMYVLNFITEEANLNE